MAEPEPPEPRRIRIGIDVGGTFTDVVAVDATTRRILARVKTPTTHAAEDGVAKGIIDGLRTLLERENIDPAEIAREYASAGADAISVLTESDHFLGDLAYLDIAREAAPLPILRKDFLSTPYEVAQSAAYGADAVLAIVAGLSDEQIAAMFAEARRWQVDVLVEVHNEAQLHRALEHGATLLGINNRDLRTFETNLAVTEELLPLVPPVKIVISESGLRTQDQTHHLAQLGARGFLIGETLMRAADKTELIRGLKGLPVPA